MPSTFISVNIARTAATVYAFVLDPGNLSAWAPGLVGTGQVDVTDEGWIADSPMGRIVIVFAGRNPYGVLDHDVTLPSGQVVSNPLRVVPDGEGSELTFTLRRLPGVSDEAFGADVAAVTADLQALKTVLERR